MFSYFGLQLPRFKTVVSSDIKILTFLGVVIIATIGLGENQVFGAGSRINPPTIESTGLPDDAKRRKDEFLKHVREQLGQIEHKMGELKEKGEVLREKTKENLKAHLEKLQEQKQEIIPELEKAQRSGEAAWEDLKKDIDQMVNNLKKSLEQAASKFF